MPREQLRELVQDVRRLLSAGSSAAVGDTGLSRRGQTLRTLAAQVPALVPVADAIERVLKTPGNRAAAPLCDLLGVTRQVAASLTTAGREGRATPVKTSGPWQTTMAVQDVEKLAAKSFDRSTAGDKELQKALDRPDFADLRLLPRLMRKLSGAYWANEDDSLSDVALPAYGPTVLPELLDGLDFKSGYASARRLRAIARLDPKQGTDLCRKAVTEGTETVRIAALGVLQRIAPKDAEKAAIGILVGTPPWELASAGIGALVTARSDEALEAILRMLLHKSDAVVHTAAEALGKIKNARAGKELLSLLETTLAQAQKPPEATGKTKGKAKGKSTAAAEAEALLDKAQLLVGALGERGEVHALPALTGLLKHKEARIREAAVNALTLIGEPSGLAAAIELVDDSKVWRAVFAAIWGLPAAERFDRLAPYIESLGKSKKNDQKSVAVLKMFESEMNGGFGLEDEDETPTKRRETRTDWDPRWVPLLRKHLTGPKRPEIAIALAVVLRDKAIPELLAQLEPSVKKNECGLVEALGYLKAREAISAMIPLMPKQPSHHYCIHDALRKINDLAAIPLLEGILETTKDTYRRNRIEVVIEDLQKANKT